MTTEFRAGERGLAPVVSKTLAIGLVVLYVTGMTSVLLGGVVPDYERRAGGELGERVLATVAAEVEQTPPAVGGRVDAETTVELPATIANSGYTLVLSNQTDRLVLDHPDPAITAETRLSLPPNVTPENGTVDSGGNLQIRVRGSTADRRLTITEGDS
jgi:hypothetical protein